MQNNFLARFVLFTAVFLAAIFGVLMLHNNLMVSNEWKVGFSLHHVYYFFGVSGFCTYLAIEGVAKAAPDKASYTFLVMVMIKLGLFMILFMGETFRLETNLMTSKLSVVIPLFLFLGLEAIATVVVLKSLDEQSKKSVEQ